MNAEARMTDMSESDRDRGRTLGAILVTQGRLAPADAAQVQQFARKNGLRFGEAAQRLNLLTQQDIDVALAHQFNYPVLARSASGGVSDELVAGYNPQSESVEPLRALRSQIVLRWLGQSSESRRVLTVVSSERGEGRSWITANLAIVLAQIGYRTLIIDTDLRHSRQHQLFNLPSSAGLSALLTGRAGKEVVQRVHPQLRLFVLAAGAAPPNPQELLGRPVFDLVLSTFANQYDVVLLDTPAFSETADGLLLASISGAALVVTRRNHTKIASLHAAVQNLNQSGVNIIGSVMNAC
jgi:receptor protein-tyrosine kinase